MENNYWGNNGIILDANNNQHMNNDISISDNLQLTERQDNTIYFYSGVRTDSVLKLNKELRYLSVMLMNQGRTEQRDPSDIYLRISSYGGSLLDGFSALDDILNCPVNVNTIIDGKCASAGTLLSIAGNRRYIKRHSYILIHQLSAAAWGTYEYIKDYKENLDKFMHMLKGVYKERTKMPMKKLNEILKHDIWLNADEALEYGLVDEVI